ncbi:phosphodiesterase [Nocardia higoensis]|uniref:Phosphodiesterase n=1 Tax=Nocardia higoensis TaxID=228599 RepID=A0ABS0DC29_9NOCA|nr:phosphodiesterase [Nocardia higoensis]MBF6356037.1 phosphodiesterase [Nocardia higoensis]
MTQLFREFFAGAARLRHARVFHPNGLPLSGRLHPEPEVEDLFGEGERAVLARMSKGIGTPSGLPDVLGLALRVLDRDDKPFDLALATTGEGVLGRYFLTPARGWRSARYGSLMPYRLGDRSPVWLFAEPEPGLPSSSSLDDLEEHVRTTPIEYTLSAAGLIGRPRKIARVTLHPVDAGDYRTDFFDPVMNHPDDVRLLPEVVGRVRELAYSGSREGRGQHP